MKSPDIKTGLTFDDVLLAPAYSGVMPRDVDVRTRLTKEITLNIPLISAAMDCVTEARMAIAIAQEGGIGIIHKNLTMEEQISGFPVVKNDILVGIVTNRDIRFEKDAGRKISEIMTKDVVTAPLGIAIEKAKEILHRHRIEKLPLIDGSKRLRGLVTITDIEKRERFPGSCKDKFGRLMVGAAVGVSFDRDQRVDALLKAGADVIVVDTAHGHSKGVIESV